MDSIADAEAPEASLAIPRLEDGFVNMREPLGQLAESVVNEMMSAEADQLCEATGNGRSGYRERGLVTCVGTLAPRVPKLRTGSLLPDDATGRCQRVDGAAAGETRATGTSTRKVQGGWPPRWAWSGCRRTRRAPYASTWTRRRRSWPRGPSAPRARRTRGSTRPT